MDSPSDSEKPLTRTWWDDFKNPVNLVGWALAVIGIGISVFLYFKSKETRELSLRLVAVTKVYDSSSTSRKLSVLDSENKRVTNDVYVASYQLWNSGTLPIEPADIRRPFKMQMIGDARTLDWTITYCISDPDVCGFHFEANDTNASPRSVTLKWLHCDPQHGCQIQFLYAGTANADLSFESPFSGNGQVVDATRVGRRKSEVAARVCVISFLSFGVLLVGWGNLRKHRQMSKQMDNAVGILVVALLATAALSFVWVVVGGRPLKTPFPPNVPINFNMPSEAGSH